MGATIIVIVIAIIIVRAKAGEKRIGLLVCTSKILSFNESFDPMMGSIKCNDYRIHSHNFVNPPVLALTVMTTVALLSEQIDSD